MAWDDLKSTGSTFTADEYNSMVTYVKSISSDSTGITIDGGGGVITTGIKGDIYIPYDCTIDSCTLISDSAGSIVIDIWKDTYDNFPPTDINTIVSTATPTLDYDDKSQDFTLTGWTTTITSGDILRYNVDSATTVTRCSLILGVTKT